MIVPKNKEFTMKKRLALGLAGVMVISALTGCGKTSSKYLLDEKYSNYVKLCDYKGVEATKVTYDVTEDEIAEEVDTRMYDYVTYDPITDRGIEIGDYANVDYVATIEGEESEDYSSENEDVLVGEGSIITEIEDTLVGMKTGEKKTVKSKLTEEYAEEADVGKEASFEVTVNEISVENIPEYNEEFVTTNTDYKTIADYEDSIKEDIKASKDEEYKYSAIDEIMTFLLDNSTFDGYPEELYSECEENFDASNEYYASMYGMELEDFMEAMGIDEESKKEEIEYNVNYELIIGAIAQEEGFDCTEKELNDFVNEIYEDYGYESADAFLADYSEDEIGYEVIYEKVVDFLYENASFKEITEDQYLEEQAEMYSDEEIEDVEIEEETGEDETEADETGADEADADPDTSEAE